MNYQGKGFLERSPRSPGRPLSPSRPRGRGRTSPGLALPEGPWSVGSSWQLFRFEVWECLLACDINLLTSFQQQKVNFSEWYSQLKNPKLKKKTMKIIPPSPQAGWNYQLGLSIQFHLTKSWSRKKFKGFFLLFSPVNHPDCAIVILHCFVDPLARLQSVS